MKGLLWELRKLDCTTGNLNIKEEFARSNSKRN